MTTATGVMIPALKSLPAAVLLLAGMTACSDDMPGGNETNGVLESTVMVGNDPAAQAHRITFYGASGSRAAVTRAAEDFPAVGKEPVIPDGTIEFDTPNAAQQSSDESRKTAYVLKGGEGQIEVYGGNVYIKGEVKTHNINGAGGTIYVMSGAKLILKSEFNNQNARIVAFGELVTEGGLTLGSNDQILVENDFKVNGDLNVEGTVVVKEHLEVTGKIQFNGDGKGRVKGKCISVGAEGDRAVDMSGGGELAIRSYIYCNSLYMGNSASVYLWPNAMADVHGTTAMTSKACGFYYYSSEGKTGIHSLLKTEKFHVEDSADDPEYVGGLFKGELKIKYGELENCNPAFEEKFVPSADDYYIPSDVNHGGCNPGNGKAEESKPFDQIAVIDGPTHEHNHLSATCIQPVGNLAYVSFHLNEAYEDNMADYVPTSKHMGCVEVYDVTETGAQISSWLMNQDFDFNHLLVDADANTLYTVGDTKKYGATLGVVKLTDGKFGQFDMGDEDREDVMKYYNLYKKTEANRGSSGNCIIRDGDYFRIASYQGFQSLKVSDLSESKDAFVSTPGSAKHIAKNGDFIVTLNLDDKGVDSSTGTVTVYNTWGNMKTSFTTDVITPIDGKNVIYTDGTHIYVALGETGVAKYDMSGNLMASYSWIAEKQKTDPGYNGRPCANGLAVDDKYVYVANGGAGLIVLDKVTMRRVARYSRGHGEEDDEKYYSANYVQKVGDLIYIAYGRNGLEIVKMREDRE